MLGLIILGVMLLGGAFKLLRARKAGAGAGPRRRAVDPNAATALGFLPADRLDTDHGTPPEPGDVAVLDAVRAGDWEAGAAWLDAAGQDWDERFRRVRDLADLAAEDDAWLLAWRARRPEDPSAAAVQADTSVLVAWQVRGSLGAEHTTQEQFRLFHRLIASSQEVIAEARRLADPADPVPYMLEQPVAMALGYPHEQYGRLWAEIVKRDPKVLSAHTGALQYWCRKWRGSHAEAEAFAKASAASGAPGDLLSLLPLIAYLEHEMSEAGLAPEVFYQRPHVVAATDAALADVAAADPADRRVTRVRHMLAWNLHWQGRYAEAVEQFRAVDGYIGATPWTYAADSRSRYVRTRDLCVREAAA
ncbi:MULTISPECIES: hypothetical protein [unclassified Streptomyces]|uniref:hypothetical protein n=1 Tax=unclassified Streptomyces TaxID=2593676 RepID=UPI00109ED768|nr:hypothetical protein [Streptomyces sp. A1136]THA49589.1 hypothetical protein E6R62_27590 [Streptomyces sp. A1136]